MNYPLAETVYLDVKKVPEGVLVQLPKPERKN
jgi:hypothetical protein